MPRYFFHTCDGMQDIDRLGHVLADDEAARREAVRYGAGLLSDDPDLIVRDDQLRINVMHEDGCLSCAILILAVDANRQPAEDISAKTPAAPSSE